MIETVFPSGARANLFTIQDNKDNVFLWDTGWVNLLASTLLFGSFFELRVSQLGGKSSSAASIWITPHYYHETQGVKGTSENIKHMLPAVS